MEEQEGEEEGRNQLQEEPGAEEGSDGPEEEWHHVYDGQVQGRTSLKGGGTPKKGTAMEELQEIVNVKFEEG